MADHPMRIHSVGPDHPGYGKPSAIRIVVSLDWLKNAPVEFIVVKPDDALEMAEHLIAAVRATR